MLARLLLLLTIALAAGTAQAQVVRPWSEAW
jgi:hypothetical protein